MSNIIDFPTRDRAAAIAARAERYRTVCVLVRNPREAASVALELNAIRPGVFEVYGRVYSDTADDIVGGRLRAGIETAVVTTGTIAPTDCRFDAVVLARKCVDESYYMRVIGMIKPNGTLVDLDFNAARFGRGVTRGKCMVLRRTL